MSQVLALKPRGLWSHPNPLSEAPAGALLVARNVIQAREGLLDVLRGRKRYGNALTLSSGQRPNVMFNYKERRILQYHNLLAYDSDGAGAWTNYSGTYSPPTGATRIRATAANKNFYFTSSAGIKKLDALAGTPTNAGMVRAIDLATATTGATGWMANNNQAAYRAVWGIKDANNNLILGAPSQRSVVVNSSGGTRDVAVTVYIPTGITTSHILQVYRSAISGGVAIVPNDELQLVYEVSPTNTDISNGFVTFTDISPDNLRGAALYTNPSQQGINQSNDQPPLAQDITTFNNITLYANTISKQRFIITLVAVGSPSGVQNDDTITIGGVVYTGKGAETVASGFFKVTTSGTPAENIEATALSLVHVINGYASNTLYYAYYLSGPDDVPGKILIEERGLGGVSYAFVSSRATPWSPQLPTSGTTVSSSNETAKNRIYCSKALQPEAVPLLNNLNVGSADADILRIVALRDSVFIFKEDGIFRLIGDTFSNFRVTLFDNTTTLLAPDTAVAFNNQVFGFFDQGIVAVSDNGVAVVSRPIEADLLALTVPAFTNFSSISWALGYESERTYFLFLPTISSDTYATQCYTFNAFTSAWTGPHMILFSAGIVGDNDDVMYLGSDDPNSKYVYKERKALNDTDFALEEFAVTITTSSGTTVNMSSTTNVVAGQTLLQGARQAIVVSVDSATAITVNKTLTWQAGAATVYNPIPIEVRFIPQTCGNPGIVKQFADVVSFFRRANFTNISMGFSSNFSTYREDIELEPIATGLWGLFPWGEEAWGGSDPDIQPLRTYVHEEKQMANWLDVYINMNEALANFSYAGTSIIYEEQSERFH